eukprot:TRINITY_DN12348_c0_g1_i2.p2 TRINITY_DN12348_c0_g1~~TRINITY_DN12348_c0_g1_i2.p2  ORF type:complete len:204 (+),score=82.65 TRINITY_DN12348_c0_g1_i2:103-714(+)
MGETDKPAQSVKVEDVTEDSDDDMPELETPAQTNDAPAGSAAGIEGDGKQSRAEKKARKAMAKLGLKPVTGVSRVTLKRAKNKLLVITKPDVYKAGNDYVIFGEAKVEDLSQGAANALRNYGAGAGADGMDYAQMAAAMAEAQKAQKATVTEETSDEAADATGLEEKDIELVISQTKASRNAAIKALQKNKGDIVNAIMELTI